MEGSKEIKQSIELVRKLALLTRRLTMRIDAGYKNLELVEIRSEINHINQQLQELTLQPNKAPRGNRGRL